MKNYIFKICIIFIFLMIIISFLETSYALDPSNIHQFEGYDNWAKRTVLNRTIEGHITTVLGIVLTILRTITLGFGIWMAVLIAIKYFSSGPQIKAQTKTDIPTYAIGCVLLFGASGLFRLIQYFVEDVIK